MQNIHYLSSHYNPAFRGQLFPYLKPFIKSSRFTDLERVEMYQVSETEVEYVTNIKAADICILTMSWNYYVEHNLVDKAKQYILEANAKGKQVWTWMSGDFGVDLKLEADYLVFRNSGHKSQLSEQHIGMPVFIGDPLQKFYKTSQLSLPDYDSKPIVGFCGQANSSLKQVLKEHLIRLHHLMRFKIGKTKNPPQPIQSTSLLRAQLLDRLEASKVVTTNFIRREKYRAGVTRHKDKHQTTQEFYDNIKDSHYVLCVRGGGNFSVRFYETLAMGRIPVFINTDSLLPLENKINWKEHCVWVDFKDRGKVSEKVKFFHEAHTQESLYSLMQANRKLWENQLRIGNFFKTIT
ncbi:exostosin domain-containing protein [Psychroflexus montanilacus]|uniref:exostosin domain-containing protein n=1 Tax=Psychroflexus montanilacus TaxID=2873598 RepID=UPI001CCE71A6|nr:exostosin family protein [Psychroflexus montanilacus]MBZ9652094.1 glycosyltransferase family 47 protein [Psychroflexus montanilacus]